MRIWSLAALLAFASGGCIPTDFEDRRAGAQTVAIAPPDDYPIRGFGQVVGGYGGSLGGTNSTRVIGSAGQDSPFSVFPLLIGDEVRLNGTVANGCDSETPCDPAHGASLVGMPTYGGRELCVAIPSFDTGAIKVRCEDNSRRFDIAQGAPGERLGFSGVGLHDHPFGRAIFGAPSAGGTAGAVYRLPDAVATPPVAIDFSAGMGVGDSLGSAVAASAIDADTVLLAAGAPGGGTKRVIVITADIDPAGVVTTSVHACLDETTDGWGGALVAGDLNADGVPDLVVGSAPPGATGMSRLNAVRVYDGAAMPAAGSCMGNWPVAVEIACPSTADVTCGTQFGVSIAIGDFDGDGTNDLLVGEPTATVDEVGGAGAAFVFQGTPSLSNLGDTMRALRHSTPRDGANLGMAVAVSPGQTESGRTRDEAIVGAPGADRVYVFLCTGLPDDRPEDQPGQRCQPLAMP